MLDFAIVFPKLNSSHYFYIAQSAGIVEYRDWYPPTSVMDMTLNNLMMRFQQYWSFGECGVPLYAIAPRSTLAGLVAPDRALSIG